MSVGTVVFLVTVVFVVSLVSLVFVVSVALCRIVLNDFALIFPCFVIKLDLSDSTIPPTRLYLFGMVIRCQKKGTDVK